LLGVKSNTRYIPLVIDCSESITWHTLRESVQYLFNEATKSLQDTNLEQLWEKICASIPTSYAVLESTNVPPFPFVIIFESEPPSSMYVFLNEV
jgi:hypothetical protein